MLGNVFTWLAQSGRGRVLVSDASNKHVKLQKRVNELLMPRSPAPTCTFQIGNLTVGAGLRPRPQIFTWLFTLFFLLTTFVHPTYADTEKREKVNNLLMEASEAFALEHPIDARGKLLKALKVDPEDYRVHLYLAEYYLQNVGHFKLAYRYIEKADQLFKKYKDTYPKNLHKGSKIAILALRSAAELNLDKYEESLATLEELEKLNWNPNIPGSKAWILWKLGKTDEAIKVAQDGIVRGAEPTRIYNMLGILLSSKDNRELALNAFANAIRAEIILTGSKNIATPLNNAGEVYRELFMDRYAESSWRQAVVMPDGCEHVLPSLNLAILLLDELRLDAAERALSDFEICFKENAERLDSEHKTLLALHRGKLALHRGDFEEAEKLIQKSIEKKQWFGNIGTNENDMRFAAYISMADAFDAKIIAINDKAYTSIKDSLIARAEIPWIKLNSWWYRRRAREIAINELDDLEDLFIRHTDAMVAYPTLGSVLSGFSLTSLKKRLERMKASDNRKLASNYYDLYLAEAYLEHGKTKEAELLLKQVILKARVFERLLKAQSLGLLIRIKEDHWSLSSEQKEEINRLKLELYKLHPSYLRYYDLKLPVRIKIGTNYQDAKSMIKHLTSTRFKNVESGTPYTIELSTAKDELKLVFKDPASNLYLEEKVNIYEKDAKQSLINNFTIKVFSHKVDHPGEALPSLPILKGVM